jgi:hypothetical protein
VRVITLGSIHIVLFDTLLYSTLFNQVIMEGAVCRRSDGLLKDPNQGGSILTEEDDRDRDRNRRTPYVGRLAPTPSGYMHGKD